MISKVRFFMKSDLGVAWIFFLRMVGGLCRANRSQPPATRCMCSSLVFLKVLYEHHCYRKYCYWSGSIANHRGETAEQTEEGRIPPFMQPSVFLSEYFAPNHYSHRQGERPTHQLAESLCRDELVNKKCYEKA